MPRKRKQKVRDINDIEEYKITLREALFRGWFLGGDHETFDHDISGFVEDAIDKPDTVAYAYRYHGKFIYLVLDKPAGLEYIKDMVNTDDPHDELGVPWTPRADQKPS